MGHDHTATAAYLEMLDLDGIVLAEYWREVHSRVRNAAPEPVRRVLDLGAGTGNGAVGFAASFPAAEIVAVDTDAAMLARVAEKADGRVRTELVDLDAAFPEIADVDVAWASLSLHHLTDPEAVLARIRSALRPAGLLAVAELAEPIRFLTDKGDAAVEQRWLDAVRHELAHELPHLDSDWPARLTRAGFTVTEQHEIAIDVPYSPRLGRYAFLWFDRLRQHAGFDAADRAALDELLAHDVAGRTDLRARGTRTLLLARLG